MSESRAAIDAALRRAGSLVHPADVDDLRSQVMVRLLRRLQNGPTEDIESFNDYAAVVTYHVVNDYARRRMGNRTVSEENTERAVDDRTEARIVSRDLASRLWQEIRQLPLRQRIALLLNLPDNGLPLFIITGVATLPELARELEWTEIRLAEAWTELPYDDARIGALLGVSSQQVINLRKSARARLQRRMKKW